MRVDLQLRDNAQLVEISYGIQKYLQDTYIRKYCNEIILQHLNKTTAPRIGTFVAKLKNKLNIFHNNNISLNDAYTHYF